MRKRREGREEWEKEKRGRRARGGGGKVPLNRL
jgi:hypothetical protein